MERLGDVARKIMGSANPAAADDLVAIARAWPTAVGVGIAAAAWPNRLARDGSLHVATVSSVWAFELGGMQSQILAQLRGAVPSLTVTSLRFAVGPVPAPSTDSEPPTGTAPQPSDSDREDAAMIAAAIDDDDLRLTVARAAAASLARARSDRDFW